MYALDEVGNVIDYVTTIEPARDLRNAAEPDVAVVPTSRSGSSDLRYALETVSHIARTNADAMRSVAESQAEWIKAISSARGFFRNAPPQLAVPTEFHGEDEVSEHEEFDLKTSWVEKLQPVIGMVVQQIVAALMAPKTGDGGAKLQLADLLDWRRAAAKRELPPEVDGPNTAVDPVALQTALASKAIAMSSHLEPAEQVRLMKLAPMLSKLAADPEISRLLAELVTMSTEDSVAWIRKHIDEIEKGLAS